MSNPEAGNRGADGLPSIEVLRALAEAMLENTDDRDSGLNPPVSAEDQSAIEEHDTKPRGDSF